MDSEGYIDVMIAFNIMAEFVAEVFCHNIFSGLPYISRSLKGEW